MKSTRKYREKATYTESIHTVQSKLHDIVPSLRVPSGVVCELLATSSPRPGSVDIITLVSRSIAYTVQVQTAISDSVGELSGNDEAEVVVDRLVVI